MPQPYSLALVAAQALSSWDPQRVSVLGIDLNPASLTRARAGRYQAWALRETPLEVREQQFQSEGAAFVLRDPLRGLVRFEQRNLVQPDPGFWRAEAFDVVFCRNVLMYMTQAAAREVVARIARSLVPGGALFLGHAENLRALSQEFHLEHEHESFYYTRRGAEGSAPSMMAQGPESPRVPAPAFAGVLTAPVQVSPGWIDTIQGSSARIAELARGSSTGPQAPASTTSVPGAAGRASLAPALDLLRRERYGEALAALDPDLDGEPEALLLRAVLHSQRGDLAAAEEACRRLLARDELDAEAHHVMALCREQQGARAEAAEHERIAAYLEPGFALPHLHLGLLARRAGDRAEARRELQRALELLPREDPSRLLLFGGGFGREALLQLCRAELAGCGAAP